jgi:chromosome segregation ATPase
VAIQALQAQDATPNPQEAALVKMRGMLRDALTQAQDAQNQVVTLQAQVTQDAADKKALQDKLDALSAQLKTISDQAAADKNDATKQIADLKAEVDDKTGQIGRLNDGINKWKVAYDSTAQLAATNEAARKQYALQAALLKRTVDDREVKNLALFKLANEILDRYEKFSLGDALAAKEPFTGLTRVKLENLVQDYKNKILDQGITTGKTTASLPPPVAPAPAQPVRKPATPFAAEAPPAPAGNGGPRTVSARTNATP